jgi:pimeloyl-ACP methyl ester carboxylesterase
MQLSVVCSEDLPRLDTNEIAAATAGTFLGDALLQRIQAACADWPRAVLPDGFFDPISSDIPTLLLSGAADPVTPPRWAAAAAAHLTHNVQAIAPGGAHINVGNGCGYTLMRDLVQAGSVEGLDPSCMQDAVRPPFIVDSLGPAR